MPIKPDKNTPNFAPPLSINGMAASSQATVIRLVEPIGLGNDSGVVRRLSELGFLPGESVSVLRRGPGGREPIAVQVGDTVFALRSIEAACVLVEAGS